MSWSKWAGRTVAGEGLVVVKPMTAGQAVSPNTYSPGVVEPFFYRLVEVAAAKVKARAARERKARATKK